MQLQKPIYNVIIALCGLSFIGSVQAQSTGSPYSRFGLGITESYSTMENRGMGGISAARQSTTGLNPANPASFAAIKSTILETGASMSIMRLKSSTRDQSYVQGSLDYLALAFPVTKRWGFGFGLIPYSSVGYKVLDTKAVDSIGSINYTYEGDGGLSQFFIGNGVRIGKSWYAGFTASYLFGNIIHRRSVEPQQQSNTINTRFDNSVFIGDFYFDGGLQYIQKKEKKFLIVGYSIHPAQKIGAKENILTQRYKYSGFSRLVIDTVDYKTNESVKVNLPISQSLGFSYGKTGKWLVGGDLSYTNGSAYKSDFDKLQLKDNFGVSFGGQITPKEDAIGNYLRNIEYRAGAHYNTGYLQLNSTQINEWGASVGLGLPLAKARSKVNIAVEYLQRGTTSSNLLKEEYTRIFLSFTMNDTWFIRRKYD